MARPDPHSYADDTQAQTAVVDLSLRVDFEQRVLAGECALEFVAPSRGPLDLDTRDLSVEAVTTLGGYPLAFELHPPEPILGARLRIELPAQGAQGVRVRYRTSPSATALQWLAPAQTHGRAQPYLYSQCQPIHARSLAPLQDTPRIRVRTRARFVVPARLRTLMAAASMGRVAGGPGEAIDSFEMPQPIPTYLLAFVVGDLSPRQLSARCAVWAERGVVDDAADEFAQVEDMIVAAEELFGPYEWDRYDLLVMPPSFPYGGMENPRLTFVTPSLLAGDRSLVNVIAHELAHAWTGSLVTNASANDFWLNEGFTVYAERRILEAMEGRESAELHAAIGRHELDEALTRFAARPELTRLRTDLTGVDPDQAFSTVPYEKGYLLLRALEQAAGRSRFDGFLRDYLEKFRFRSIVTQDFIDLVSAKLPRASAQVRLLEWIDGPGVPADAPRPSSARLQLLEAGEAEPQTATELLVHLRSLPPQTPDQCTRLDARFGLSSRQSIELRHAFVLLQLRAGGPKGVVAAARLLSETGRMKYLRPLFRELVRTDRAVAEKVYAERREGYHPIARGVIEGLLRGEPGGATH